MADRTKPNCYKCDYRGTVPGSAHSRCDHPLVGQDSNSFAALVDMFSGGNKEAADKLGIKANARGVRSGWFMWPANFDPVWLESCNGFTENEREMV